MRASCWDREGSEGLGVVGGKCNRAGLRRRGKMKVRECLVR